MGSAADVAQQVLANLEEFCVAQDDQQDTNGTLGMTLQECTFVVNAAIKRNLPTDDKPVTCEKQTETSDVSNAADQTATKLHRTGRPLPFAPMQNLLAEKMQAFQHRLEQQRHLEKPSERKNTMDKASSSNLSFEPKSSWSSHTSASIPSVAANVTKVHPEHRPGPSVTQDSNKRSARARHRVEPKATADCGQQTLCMLDEATSTSNFMELHNFKQNCKCRSSKASIPIFVEDTEASRREQEDEELREALSVASRRSIAISCRLLDDRPHVEKVIATGSYHGPVEEVQVEKFTGSHRSISSSVSGGRYSLPVSSSSEKKSAEKENIPSDHTSDRSRTFARQGTTLPHHKKAEDELKTSTTSQNSEKKQTKEDLSSVDIVSEPSVCMPIEEPTWELDLSNFQY